MENIITIFHKFKQNYRYPRITIQLIREYKIKINRKTTYRYMQIEGIKSNIRSQTRKYKEEEIPILNEKYNRQGLHCLRTL